jgi:alcohol dehydrogenase YqhD (iron-dependent ADH family)
MPTKVIFGKGQEENVGAEIAAYGTKKVLLHYGQNSIKKSGLYGRIIKSMEDAGLDFIELSGVQPNPILNLVHEGIELCRKENVDFILAVGGGSVIDSSKGIGIGVKYNGDVWDFYAGKPVENCLPIGVVLTIPAAGSETSPNSVITNEDGDFKRGIGAQVMRPKFAILNPELPMTLPPYHMACGAVDIMAHVMERYFTNIPNVKYTDRLCEATLKTVIENIPKVLADNKDYDAWAEIMWAGSLAHNGLLGTGRAEDWGSHMIEHEISGIYDVAHGAGLAVVFPAWQQYVYKKDINRFAQFANRVWGVEYKPTDLEGMALEGIAKMKSFFSSIGMPVSLKELDIPADRIDEMATKVLCKGDFLPLTPEHAAAILRIAL